MDGRFEYLWLEIMAHVYIGILFIQCSMHGTFDKHIFFNWDFLSFPTDPSNSSGV